MPRLKTLIVLICVALLQSSASEAQRKNPERRLVKGKFQFRLPDLKGNRVTSSDKRFKNKVVLFQIWGTWYTPKREMTPFLKDLHAELASEGLEIVSMAFERPTDDGRDPKELVADHVTENDIRYLTLYGGAAKIASSLVFKKLTFREFDGFPTIVIQDRDGNVKMIEERYDEDMEKHIEALVRELLASS